MNWLVASSPAAITLRSSRLWRWRQVTAPGRELFSGGLRRLDDLAKAHLVGLGQKRKAPGLVEVQAKQVWTGASGALG